MIIQFLWGALAMGCVVTGLFFWKFWRDTRETLFLSFALAFWVFALNWTGLAVLRPADESRHYLYGVRLLAFLLIITGIINKNRNPPRKA